MPGGDYVKPGRLPRSGAPGKFKMGSTGTKQEDQIITVQLEQAFGLKWAYVPFKGGGDVAVNLEGGADEGPHEQGGRRPRRRARFVKAWESP